MTSDLSAARPGDRWRDVERPDGLVADEVEAVPAAVGLAWSRRRARRTVRRGRWSPN